MSDPVARNKHFDDFVEFDDLPRKVQKDQDWAKGTGHRFVRVRYGRRIEFVPLENFQRLTRPTPAGLKADGFATDSMFSGAAISFNSKGAKSRGKDYEVWTESW